MKSSRYLKKSIYLFKRNYNVLLRCAAIISFFLICFLLLSSALIYSLKYSYFLYTGLILIIFITFVFLHYLENNIYSYILINYLSLNQPDNGQYDIKSFFIRSYNKKFVHQKYCDFSKNFILSLAIYLAIFTALFIVSSLFFYYFNNEFNQVTIKLLDLMKDGDFNNAISLLNENIKIIETPIMIGNFSGSFFAFNFFLIKTSTNILRYYFDLYTIPFVKKFTDKFFLDTIKEKRKDYLNIKFSVLWIYIVLNTLVYSIVYFCLYYFSNFGSILFIVDLCSIVAGSIVSIILLPLLLNVYEIIAKRYSFYYINNIRISMEEERDRLLSNYDKLNESDKIIANQFKNTLVMVNEKFNNSIIPVDDLSISNSKKDET